MTCAIIIPVYRAWLSPQEKISFLRLKQLIQQDVFLVAPEGLELVEYLKFWPEISCERFDASFFVSISSYNRLMLSSELYSRFESRFEWMLVHQLDVFLFHANFQKFCGMQYDYFGAPWVPSQLVHPRLSNGYLLKVFGAQITVGNGGLSLRRISSTMGLLKSKRLLAENWLVNEDAFYAYCGEISKDFKVCPLDVAAHFAFEKEPELLYEMNGKSLPLGCHAYLKYSQHFYASKIMPYLAHIEGVNQELIDSLCFQNLGEL
jgi:hypothetical protein